MKKKVNLKEFREAKNNYVSDWEISQMMPDEKEREEKEKQKNENQNNNFYKKI